MTYLLAIVQAPADGVSMSWEGIVGMTALFTALGGIGAVLLWVGRQSQRIDQIEKDNARLETSINSIESQWTAKMDRLIATIDEKLDRIWEYLHQISSRRRNDSKPPLGDD